MAKFMRKTLKPHWKSFIRMLVILVSVQIIFSYSVFSQAIPVNGKVTDTQTGEGIPGVTVLVQGTVTGTVTNIDGAYQLNVPAQNSVLVFSFIGYTTQEIVVNGKTTIDVILEVSTTQLDEVVAIGYGTARRKDLTGSVASLSGDELKKMPISNAAEAIKGRLPGVNVITTDGSPDAEVVIRVRGGGSVTQDNSPLYVVDGFIVGSIRDIPPGDIANINVLKDAAATAIYGAQAANGVILITTKSPVAGKTNISYNGYAQFKTLPAERKYEVLDPYEFVMVQYERAKMRSDADLRNFEKYFGKYDDLELYRYKKPTDWQEELFGESQVSWSHNVSMSGGTEKTKLSLSFSNNSDDGIMVGNDYTRNVINFKLNHEISNKLDFEGSARITDTKVNGAGTAGSAQLRVKNIITARPVNGIADELDIDLTKVDTDDDYQSFLLSLINPLELAEQDWRHRITKNYVLQAGIGWEPIENLNLKTTFSSSTSFDEQQRYYGPLTSQSQQEGNSLPLGTFNQSQNQSYRWLNTVNYVFKDLGEHNLDLLFGQEIYSNGGKGSAVRAENFRESITPEEMFANMALGTIDGYSTYQSTNQNRLSFFGRANYQFRNRYLVTATLRSDMSSKFSEENRNGLFPAVAFAWKMNEESFLSGNEKINELKLRFTYGSTGNDRIPANATKFLFSPSTNNGPGMGTNAYNVYYSPEGSTLYNPDIVWETTINRNIGADFMFCNGAIRGNIDLYKNTTKNLLLASAISPISGFNTQWNNIGSTSNKGIEMLLSTLIFDRENFSFNANFNFGYNKAKIDELDGTDERFFQSNWASTDLKDRDDYYLQVGETIGLIYGYRADEMYTVDDFESYNPVTETYVLRQGVPDNKNTLGIASVMPGFMKLKDISGPDGVPDGLINSMDRTVIGSALPEFVGGFGFDASFYGFDVSALFNFSVGNDIYNTGKIDYNQLYRSTYGNMLNSMNSSNRFTYIDVDGSITGVAGDVVTDLNQLGQMNSNKTIWSGSNSFGQATAVISDWAVEDGSFLRFNTLTLGYTIPQEIISRVKISNLRIYATGYNLWLWTNYSGYDPEVSTSRSNSYAALTPGIDYSSYPRSRSFTFGVNVTF